METSILWHCGCSSSLRRQARGRPHTLRGTSFRKTVEPLCFGPCGAPPTSADRLGGDLIRTSGGSKSNFLRKLWPTTLEVVLTLLPLGGGDLILLACNEGLFPTSPSKRLKSRPSSYETLHSLSFLRPSISSFRWSSLLVTSRESSARRSSRGTSLGLFETFACSGQTDSYRDRLADKAPGGSISLPSLR